MKALEHGRPAISTADLRPVELQPNGLGPARPVDLAGATGDASATPGLSRLSRGDRFVAWLIGLATAALGVIGFVNSFHEVAEAVRPSFAGLAWTAPLGIDLGIAVFTGLDLFLARLGMRLSWLRLVPWSLVAVTIALNVAGPAGRGDLVGAGAHGVLPLLWVIAVEVAAHVMRHWAGLGQTGEERRAAGRMDRVRASRWLLAPLSTLRIRRLMILWEERSYQAALERWMARSRARGHMAKRHGRVKWRWRAPIDQRLDYRYAQLTAVVGSGDVPPSSPARGSRDPGRSRRRQGPAPRKPAGEKRDISHLLPRGREIKARLAARGVRLNRETLTHEWRESGDKLSNIDAGPLLAALKVEGDSTRGSV